MSRSAADIVLLSSTRETLFIGPLAAFPVQARRVMLRDRLAVRDALRQFLSRPGAEEMVRPYLRRWGIDAFAMRAGGRAELTEILAQAASSGAIALALADEPVVAFARTGEDFDAHVALTLARGAGDAPLPGDFLDRLFIVACMVPDHMEGAVKHEFEMLIENGYAPLLISLVAMMIPGVNLAVLGMSLFTLPGQILDAIDKLVAVLEDVRDAKSRQELNGAAIAVAAVLAILLREGILRRFLSAKFVAKGMAAVGSRFRKPTPAKKEMRKPQPKERPEPKPQSKGESQKDGSAKPDAKGSALSPAARAAAIANQSSVATPKNKSVFYSGPGNREKALAGTKDGFVPIDETDCGKALNAENLYNKFNPLNLEADKYWSTASKRFAQEASGDVTAYVRGASPSRVFGSTELPVLLQNEKVTSINGIPRKLLLRMEDENPGAAFLAVTGNAPL